VQPISAAHTFDPVVFLSCLRLVFPTLKAFRFSCFLIVNICFTDLFFCIYLPCRSEVLGLFTLSISLPFDFISSLLLSLLLRIILFSDKKKKTVAIFFS